MQWIVHARFLRHSVRAPICWNPRQHGVDPPIGGGVSGTFRRGAYVPTRTSPFNRPTPRCVRLLTVCPAVPTYPRVRLAPGGFAWSPHGSGVSSPAPSTSLCVSEWFPFIRTVWVLSSSAVVGPLFLFCLFSRLDGMTMSWRKQDKAYSIDAGLFYGSDPTCCCALFCPRNRLSHRVPRRPGPWASISWHPRHISRSDPSGIVVFVLPHSQVCSRICRACSVSRCRLASAVQCSCFNRS